MNIDFKQNSGIPKTDPKSNTSEKNNKHAQQELG